MSQLVICIPAYKPSPAFPALIAELSQRPEVRAIVVVDDGSGAESAPLFAAAAASPQVVVLRHLVNLGKGAALKTALNFAACNYPDAAGVVTADADGQHLPHDILRVGAALAKYPGDLVLGARSFATGVPPRSRWGNRVTRIVMRAVTGEKLSDTQTGLRGIPMAFVPDLLRLRTTGYDFELDMLMLCRNSGRRIREVPVSTVYLDGNRGSHFNPLLDSMRIYFLFLRFAAVSLATAGIDNLVFALAFHFTPRVLLCQALSRLAAGSFNYYFNRQNVFHSHTSNRVAIPRYWLSVLVSGLLSYTMIQFLAGRGGVGVMTAKVGAEAILFFFSFVVQREFVFAAAPGRRDAEP